MKTIFVEARSKEDVVPLAKLLLKKLKKYETIGLVSTVQHLDELATIRNYLNLHKKKAILGKTGPRCKYPGQVLGCDVEAAKLIEDEVDAIVYLGTGEFHPVAIAVQVSKPVFTAFGNKVEQIPPGKKRWFTRQQTARLAKVKAAKKIGILVSTKLGQNNLDKALEIQKKFKNSYIFVADTINPSDMQNFSDIEGWINTTCPRLVEDQELFGKPIINWDEI